MVDELSRDVQRHLARVYAVLALCLAVSGAACFGLIPLLPFVVAHSTVFFITVCLAWTVVRVAFDGTSADRVVARFALSLASYVIAFFTFHVINVQSAPQGDAKVVPGLLLVVTAIVASFSLAAIVAPQKKRVLFVVAYGTELVALAVVFTILSIDGISLYTTTLEAELDLLLLIFFNIFLAWETDAMIRKANDDARDAVSASEQFFYDFSNMIASIISFPFRWIWRRCKGDRNRESVPLLLDSAA